MLKRRTLEKIPPLRILFRQTKITRTESIPKLLSITLFYPGVLGYFIVEIFRNFLGDNYFISLHELYDSDRSLFYSKCILLLSILIFYCCDFLNSSLTENEHFNGWGFLCDLCTMGCLTIGFRSIVEYNRNAVKWDNTLVWFNLALVGFMVVYILAYVFSKNRKNEETYKIFLWWEIILSVLFAFRVRSVYTSSADNTKGFLWFTVLLTIIPAFIYVLALRYKYVEKSEKVSGTPAVK